MPRRMSRNSFSDLYPLDASSAPPVVTTENASRHWPWGDKLLSIENHCSEVFFSFVCLYLSMFTDGPPRVCPLPSSQHLASSLSIRYTPGWCSWLLAQPCFTPCLQWPSSLFVGALVGAGCRIRLQIAPSTSAASQWGTYFSVGHPTWCGGDYWMGSHLQVS